MTQHCSMFSLLLIQCWSAPHIQAVIAAIMVIIGIIAIMEIFVRLIMIMSMMADRKVILVILVITGIIISFHLLWHLRQRSWEGH